MLANREGLKLESYGLTIPQQMRNLIDKLTIAYHEWAQELETCLVAKPRGQHGLKLTRNLRKQGKHVNTSALEA
jgi:hypothetical protein